jgi:hypothetical protein
MLNTIEADVVHKALRMAYHLGQTYWQYADSDRISDYKKADYTDGLFKQLILDTLTLISEGEKVGVGSTEDEDTPCSECGVRGCNGECMGCGAMGVIPKGAT